MTHPKLGDLDAAIWTVRNAADEIVAEFRTEEEAIDYGSHLADADRDECYSVVVGRWQPPLPSQRRSPEACERCGRELPVLASPCPSCSSRAA